MNSPIRSELPEFDRGRAVEQFLSSTKRREKIVFAMIIVIIAVSLFVALGTLYMAINEIQGRISGFNSAISKGQQQINSINSTIQSQKSQISTQQSKIAKMEDGIKGAEDANSIAFKALNALSTTDVAALTRRVQEQSRDIVLLRKTVDCLKTSANPSMCP